MINNQFLRNSQDKSYLAQNANDIKFSRYSKKVVNKLNLGTKKT